MNKKFVPYLAGLALLGISGLAAAQSSSCTAALGSYASAVAVNDTVLAQQIVSNHPQCFGGSGSAQASINTTSIAHMGAISNALAGRLLSSAGPTAMADAGVSGIAAGAATDKWNVWGNVSDNTSKLNYTNLGGTNTKTRNDVLTTVVGADYALSPSMVFGLSGSFDNGDGTATTGVNPTDNMSTRGYLVAPYFGMQLNKDLAVDASIGFGSGKMDVQNGPQSDADRLFAAANLSYVRWFDKLQVTGKLGYMHAEEDFGNSKSAGVTNTGTANKNTLDQFRVGAQAGYWMNGFMPYAGLSYAADHRSVSNQFMAVDPVGKGAFLWTLGVNFFSLPNKLTGGIAYNQESGRTNSKNESLMANINLRF